MKILFYFPTNQNSVSLETLMKEFALKGHRVFLLGIEERGAIHDTAENYGLKASVYQIPRSPAALYYVRHILYFSRFISKNRIDIVYSHTQPVNFIAVFTQYISRAKFYICRHHSDYIMTEGNKNAMFFDKVINRLGRDFIVPSKKVFHQITAVEGVEPKKVRLINYAYDFNDYQKPEAHRVQEIRNQYPAKSLLCTVSRFIPCKRYDALINCVSELINTGYDLRLIILGNGPLGEELQNQVLQLGMADRIFFIGFTTEVISFIAASDIVVHFSDSEASNSVIKEAGLMKRLIAICSDFGDFDDYVENNKSGFVLSKEDPCQDFKNVVEVIYGNHANFAELGEELYKNVLNNFSVENVIQAYTEVM